jgi:hypothetical protein
MNYQTNINTNDSNPKPVSVAHEGPLPPAGPPASGIENPASSHPLTGLVAPKSDEGGSLTHPLTTSPEPWPEPVDGKLLLDALAAILRRFVVLPKWAAEALSLWIVHTYAFHLRDVSTYIGIESPEKRCGKTTLLTVASQLVNRPVVAANISPPAFFRVIEELQPTLLIDEADTFLQSNDELRGILNSGYHKKTAFVVRVANPTAASSPSTLDPRPSTLSRFSSWCPKMIAAIGRLPDTLADRCILIRMERKTSKEECERLRNLEAEPLQRQCARFVLDNAAAIASANPAIPALNDRAADIWEPLLAIADLAGGHWPDLARQAAVGLTARAQDHNPIGSLLVDIFVQFAINGGERVHTRTLLAGLNASTDRPWAQLRKGRELTDQWLSQQLRPYGIRPRTFRIEGEQAKGYLMEDCLDVFRRYIPKAELEAFVAESKANLATQSEPAPSESSPTPPLSRTSSQPLSKSQTPPSESSSIAA